MIGRLCGNVVETEGVLAIVDVGGVGYEVTLTGRDLARAGLGSNVSLFVRQIFREDGTYLFGFLSRNERAMFDMLLTVKGCGPKVALSLLDQIGEEAIIGAVLAQDAKLLARATGVGPRLAERIGLELREKVQEQAILRKIDSAVRPETKAESDELIDALMALGYRRTEIEAAVLSAKDASGDVQEQLRHALRVLKK
jgi:Holliday junction DNA helicase RuvA